VNNQMLTASLACRATVKEVNETRKIKF